MKRQHIELVPLTASIADKLKGSLNLWKLSEGERITYYNWVCDKLALDPGLLPLRYIEFTKGVLSLYGGKECAQLLRRKHGISVAITETKEVRGILIVRTRATMPDGRYDEAMGAVAIERLSDLNLANAIMKCETKAHNRCTYAVLGAAELCDETEVDTIAGAITRNDVLQTMDTQAEAPNGGAKPSQEDEQMVDIKPLVDATVGALSKRMSMNNTMKGRS
jgi:hypothetical protein